MFNSGTLVLAMLIYMAVLFAVAMWAERKVNKIKWITGPFVYSMSLTIYCTTWTFYGSVGTAVDSGMLFLTVYLGPTLAMLLSMSITRRFIRIKERHRITSIADLISARYGKSQALAAMATLLAVGGIVPYIALQLKAMIQTVALMSGHALVDAYGAVGNRVGPVIVTFMILFTIIFGIRRLNPTERHPGMMTALTVEALVKLCAFVAAGLLITYGLYAGFDDMFARVSTAVSRPIPFTGAATPFQFTTWLSHTLLSFSAILFLPRQFHVAVVENSDETHLRTSMWLFPLYLLAINLFVFPIAMGGILQGISRTYADTFVLALPLLSGQPWLALLVFIGGISAGTGMIIVETMTIATMVSNHWVLPVLSAVRSLNPLRRRLLLCRWIVAAALISISYWYERNFGHHYELGSIGMIAFAAVMQFAPAVFGAFFWRRATRAGAFFGITAGFAIWVYTLVIPGMSQIGWVPESLLAAGPFGSSLLHPEHLLGLSFLDPITHSVFWSLAANIFFFVVGSLAFPASPEEQRMIDSFIATGGAQPPPRFNSSAAAAAAPGPSVEKFVEVREKHARMKQVLHLFFSEDESQTIADQILEHLKIARTDRITVLQLADLQAELETTLAASIGTAAAHAAVKEGRLLSESEERSLSGAYAEVLASLNIAPAELKVRVDYYQERSRILGRQAKTFKILDQASQRLSSSLDYDFTVTTILHLGMPELADAILLYVAESSLSADVATDVARPELSFSHADQKRQAAVNDGLRRGEHTISEFPLLEHCMRTRRCEIEHQSPDQVMKHHRNWDGLTDEFPIVASVSLPLASRGTILGAIAFLSQDPARYRDPDQITLLEELAHRCSTAIDNAKLYESAQRAIQAREDFLSIASHELRTPLTSLRTQVQLLTRLLSRGQLSGYPPEKMQKLLEGADRQMERLARLITELLNVSRVRSGTLRLSLEPVNLTQLIEEVVERFQPELDSARCTVTIDSPGPVLGNWDRLRLEEVVGNLLTNAMKYAPGTPIRVEIRAYDNKVRFAVQDQGMGISQKDQARLFQRFQRGTAPRHIGGFGLGLYISHQIITAHKGSICVDSEIGKGATFIVQLPLDPEQASSVPRREETG